ncbi:hypothetical protein [Subtercola lobariae]|uniref:Uncharacterized protein n=1 Tax=Subtercola lobariae TaxID=1588641 RepID=A0A917AZW6_9MICO|nr:hypothetical protein [Subtercola lobariae]GGF11418.1 hypothetical protein GCM10011399_01590 [Subtercola lobariae]
MGALGEQEVLIRRFNPSDESHCITDEMNPALTRLRSGALVFDSDDAGEVGCSAFQVSRLNAATIPCSEVTDEIRTALAMASAFEVREVEHQEEHPFEAVEDYWPPAGAGQGPRIDVAHVLVQEVISFGTSATRKARSKLAQKFIAVPEDLDLAAL